MLQHWNETEKNLDDAIQKLNLEKQHYTTQLTNVNQQLCQAQEEWTKLIHKVRHPVFVALADIFVNINLIDLVKEYLDFDFCAICNSLFAKEFYCILCQKGITNYSNSFSLNWGAFYLRDCSRIGGNDWNTNNIFCYIAAQLAEKKVVFRATRNLMRGVRPKIQFLSTEWQDGSFYVRFYEQSEKQLHTQNETRPVLASLIAEPKDNIQAKQLKRLANKSTILPNINKRRRN